MLRHSLSTRERIEDYLGTGHDVFKIDIDISYENFIDVLKYFPRAAQVGFLSPFPSHWIEPGRETGRIGRILSGVETVIWYFIIAGFLFAVASGYSFDQT